MKKKSLLTMMASLALVGALGVGATLAYFSDYTGALTNTFTIADDGIKLELFEHKVDTSEDSTGYDLTDEKGYAGEFEGNDYTNLIPGQIIEKDPTVEVGAGSVECAVYVSIENANRDVLLENVSSEWELIEESGAIRYYEYVGDNADGAYEIVGAENETVLKSIFETVTVSSDVQAGTTLPDIVIKAAAVQVEDASVESGYRSADEVQADGLATLKGIAE